jgi:spectinomycin phosphotransferase
VLEPPADLSTETLHAALVAGYGLAADEITFLPLGHDAWAWVYRATTVAGRNYFLKVRARVTNRASLLVPRFLQDHGVGQVIAPLTTIGGSLWAAAGDYALMVYPFIAGQTGMQGGMSDQQWVEYGAVLGQIHATVPAPELASIMRRDDFTPEGASLLRQLDAQIGTARFDDPIAQVFAPIWQARREQIRLVLARAEELGQRLARTAPAFVLCHADVHTNNVIVDADRRVWITDWDETILAPRERDLMFVIGGISRRLIAPRDEALVLQGYGSVEVDPLALAYYRYAWAVSDISAYADQIVGRADLGAASRCDSVDRFLSLFAPGNIVSIALGSAVNLV